MRWTLVLTLAALGCGTPSDDDVEETDTTSDPTDDTDDVASDDPVIAGVWEAEELELGVFDSYGPSRVRFIELEGRKDSVGGLLHFFGVDEGSGVLDCFSGIFGASGPGVLTVASEALDNRSEFASSIYLVAWKDEDTVELTDERGITQEFERVDEVDPDFVCGEATFGEKLRFEFTPRYASNLIFDGDGFRLMADEEPRAYRVDLDAGQIDLEDYVEYDYGSNYVNTSEGTETIWGTCYCGGNEEIVRDPGGDGSTQSYSFYDDAGSVNIRAAAFDGTDLWVVGRSRSNVNLLRRVDVSALDGISDLEVTWEADQLTFHEGVLYALSYETVFAVDTETGMATGTWLVPAPADAYRWSGIASDGDSLWLYADADTSNEVALVQVSLE